MHSIAEGWMGRKGPCSLGHPSGLRHLDDALSPNLHQEAAGVSIRKLASSGARQATSSPGRANMGKLVIDVFLT